MITGGTESRSSAGGVVWVEADEGRGGTGGNDVGSKYFFGGAGAALVGWGFGMWSGGSGAVRVGCGGNRKPALSTFGVSSTFDVEGVIEGSSSLSVIDTWPLVGDEVPAAGAGGSGISKNSSSVESP